MLLTTRKDFHLIPFHDDHLAGIRFLGYCENRLDGPSVEIRQFCLPAVGSQKMKYAPINTKIDILIGFTRFFGWISPEIRCYL